jgi:hypothetical protein
MGLILNVLGQYKKNHIESGILKSHQFGWEDSKICCAGKSLSEALIFGRSLFLHQLTHNMRTDCTLNYEFST